MRALLDTNVLSEIARPTGNAGVKAQVDAVRSEDLYLSVISFGEIAKGVAKLEPGAKRKRFEAFLLALEHEYGDRVLGIELETARIWGETTAKAEKNGRSVPVADGLIAATAIRHGLVVMTRNVSDYLGTGARTLNPWDSE